MDNKEYKLYSLPDATDNSVSSVFPSSGTLQNPTTSTVPTSPAPQTTGLTKSDIQAIMDEYMRNFTEMMVVKSNQIQSGNFVTGSSGWQLTAAGNLEANAGTFRGSLIANSLDIPNTTTANSFHVNTSGDTWWGATTLGASVASVTKAGVAIFTSVTATGTMNATGGYIGSTTALVYESQGINTGANGHIRGGQTAFNTGAGFFLGITGGVVQFSLGNPAGNYLTYDSTTAILDLSSTQQQVFTANGTWTKPAGCKFIRVVVIGAGGGGGSGRRGAVGSSRQGGGGGGSAATTVTILLASDVGATETITIGVGGAGGAAQTVDNTDGSNGGDGGLSSFGTWIVAGGGGGGTAGGSGGGVGVNSGAGGGVLTSAVLNTPGKPSAGAADGISGQGVQNSAGDGKNSEWGGASGGRGFDSGATNIGGSSIYSAGAGGGGGGIDNAANYAQPGAGGTVQAYTVGGGGAAGTSADIPTAGTAGSTNAVLKKGYGGSGGGGGGSSKTQASSPGGAGGVAGGGGGGGSGGTNGFNSGAGGAGGRGEVRIYTS